ncbi:hypothetical protein PFISCL1PPCAC_26784, partial [Pristionchus fissidentatus]
ATHASLLRQFSFANDTKILEEPNMRIIAKRTAIALLCMFLAAIYLYWGSFSDQSNFVSLGSSYIKANSTSMFYKKRPEVAHVDCARLLNYDYAYRKEIAKVRPIFVERANLNMSCPAIMRRILPARNPDTSFPILYARIVYKEYEFIEEQLATNYASENLFCFSIDK